VTRTKLEVRLTVPPGTNLSEARRVLVHALARLAVRRALAQATAEEETNASSDLRTLLD
jgi:hypothetical protein